jgi:tetratricopeptide (TPR) repeat protein
LLPAEDKPLARLHHTAHSQPGNSGGALVNISGRLVGIVTSGGEGFYEAIPATEIETLRLLSGPKYEKESQEIGNAYRQCIDALEINSLRSKSNQISSEANIIEDCVKSRNRQLFDLAGQTLGRAGQVDDAIVMFERALTQDPNAVNSRIGLVVTLHIARRYRLAVPHLTKLIKLFPSNFRILQLSIQTGKLAKNLKLARGALKLLEKNYPRLAPNFRRFLENIPIQ